jgi:hypothetical protein
VTVFLALQAATPAPPPSEDEIVVIAQKMRLIEVDMKVGKREGKMELRRCHVTRPSGRAELDVIPCDVAQQCMVEGVASRKQLTACVEDKSNARVDAIVATWRAAS